MVSITVYDGAETIGGNKIYVEEGGRGLFLDFGMNFARRNAYFDDFLSERDVRGIHDLICLDMIPTIDVYRRDLITSDVAPLLPSFSKVRPEAVLLSHAHMDHNGNIGLLDPSIPIVASATSIAIMKAMRDIGSTSAAGDIAYTIYRVKDDNDGYLLKTDGNEYHGRNFCCTGECTSELGVFLSQRPGGKSSRAWKFDGCGLMGLNEMELPFEVRAFDVNHSIYGALAYTWSQMMLPSPIRVISASEITQNSCLTLLRGRRIHPSLLLKARGPAVKATSRSPNPWCMIRVRQRRTA